MTLFHLVPRRALRRSMLILVAVIAGLMASGPASAVTTRAVSGTCSGGGQLCNNKATFIINVLGAGGVGEGQFVPGPLTCSSLRIHIIVDGTEVGVTSFVGPEQSPPSSTSALSVPESMWSACRQKGRSEVATLATSCHGLAK